ncbi:CLUMA_CG005336, isoform A [Clunio marinus]|uniref:CLUMA_CG005336, isoform A n=1 Tax=Clunio marinus TaxID=568069 RepID=A0A1J1HZX9_9DIPT|nr:CLUMA_CG005336, isoform A [Clunio marinus]
MKTFTIFMLVVAAAILSDNADAKIFKKKKWFPTFHLGLANTFGTSDKGPVAYEEHPKVVEIVKHVPVIQKVEVIKPVEIIRTVNIPVEVIKEVELIKHVPVIQEVVKEIEIIKTVEVPVEVIKEIEVIKEVPVVKTVEVAKPYQVIKHIPVVKTVEVEKQVVEKVPVAQISHYTKEIALPKIPLPNLKNPLNFLHPQTQTAHQYETT